jgi:hypothetical protein
MPVGIGLPRRRLEDVRETLGDFGVHPATRDEPLAGHDLTATFSTFLRVLAQAIGPIGGGRS